MQLSEHFALSEMCVTHSGLPNTPPDDVVKALTLLCASVLEPVRAHFGRPVMVNSGYRSPRVNASVGGAATSQHVKGQAADIEIPGVPNLVLAKWIRDNLAFDQLIAEGVKPGDPSAGWVHVSFRPGALRKSVLTMTLGSHGPVYTSGLAS